MYLYIYIYNTHLCPLYFRVLLPHEKKVGNQLLPDKHLFILLAITFLECHRNDEAILGQAVAPQTYQAAVLPVFPEKIFYRGSFRHINQTESFRNYTVLILSLRK